MDHEPPVSRTPSDRAAPSRTGLVALTVTGVLWGTIGVVVRLLQQAGMSSWSVAFWRFAVASVVLLPLLRRVQLRLVAGQLRRPARLLAVSAAALTFQLLYFFAVRDIGAGVATLIALGLGPVVLHVTEGVSARSAPPPRTVLVLLLALGGLVLVSSGDVGATVAPHPARGIAEAVGCGLVYAVSTIWSRPLVSRLSPLSITFVTSVIGLVLLLPVLAVTGWHVPRTTLTVGGAGWLGVVTTVVAYGLFYFGLRTTLGSTAMILTLLEPVTAFVLAAALLGEPLTGHNVTGGALLLLAVLALYLRPSDSRSPEPLSQPG